MQWMEVHFKLTPAMTVAFAHGTFNITNTYLALTHSLEHWHLL